MSYLVQCDKCKARAHMNCLENDHTINSFVLDEEKAKWEFDDEPTAEQSICDHEEYTVLEGDDHEPDFRD